MRRLLIISASLVVAASVSQVGLAQDCVKEADLGRKCSIYVGRLAQTACFRPGSVFIHKQEWEPADRNSIRFSQRQRVEFFYVVDATKARSPYDILFVGVDRVFGQRAERNVKLSKNEEFKFRPVKEHKERYSRGLRKRTTLQMRRWGKLPDLPIIFQSIDPEVVAKFDFPRAIKDLGHSPHARLYRFETGKVNCIPFRAGINSDVKEIFGRVVDRLDEGGREATFWIEVTR